MFQTTPAASKAAATSYPVADDGVIPSLSWVWATDDSIERNPTPQKLAAMQTRKIMSASPMTIMKRLEMAIPPVHRFYQSLASMLLICSEASLLVPPVLEHWRLPWVHSAWTMRW